MTDPDSTATDSALTSPLTAPFTAPPTASPTTPKPAVTVLHKMPQQLLFWRWFYSLTVGLLGAGSGFSLGLFVGEMLEGDAPRWVTVGVLGGLALAWPAWAYAGQRFARYRAELRTNEGVVLQDGVWWQTESWVPIARLQHLDVDQGPLDRRWGMATLTVHTAGTHDHRMRISGLTLAQAHAVRDALLPRSQGQHD